MSTYEQESAATDQPNDVEVYVDPRLDERLAQRGLYLEVHQPAVAEGVYEIEPVRPNVVVVGEQSHTDRSNQAPELRFDLEAEQDEKQTVYLGLPSNPTYLQPLPKQLKEQNQAFWAGLIALRVLALEGYKEQEENARTARLTWGMGAVCVPLVGGLASNAVLAGGLVGLPEWRYAIPLSVSILFAGIAGGLHVTAPQRHMTTEQWLARHHRKEARELAEAYPVFSYRLER